MASLRKCLALGNIPYPITNEIIVSNDIICNECVKINRIPTRFCYYGNNLCTLHRVDSNDIYFNISCDYGHHFIYSQNAIEQLMLNIVASFH